MKKLTLAFFILTMLLVSTGCEMNISIGDKPTETPVDNTATNEAVTPDAIGDKSIETSVNDIKTDAVITPDTNEQQNKLDTKTQILSALLKYTNSDTKLSDAQLDTILVIEDKWAYGSASIKNTEGSNLGSFYAVKNENGWVITTLAMDTPLCENILPYDYPYVLVQKCIKQGATEVTPIDSIPLTTVSIPELLSAPINKEFLVDGKFDTYKNPEDVGLVKLFDFQTPCSENADGPCGFTYTVAEKESSLNRVNDSDQTVYIVEHGETGLTYYGPVTINLFKKLNTL